MVKHVLLLLAGVLCLLYGTVIHGVHSGTRFFAVWYLLGAFCIGISFLGFFHVWDKIPHSAVRALAIVVIVILVMLFGTVLAILIGGTPENEECDTIIILGAQVTQDGPSVVLKYRLDAAVDYLNEHPDANCIVSGGQGYNEPCTEAEAMAAYLVKKGISPSRIIQEPNATSTLENLEFSKQYCDCSHSQIGIVTNQFHMFRSVLLARKLQYTDVVRIPAGSIPVYLPNNVLRESLAVWKDLLCGNLL